jgi:hypothetical protein
LLGRTTISDDRNELSEVAYGVFLALVIGLAGAWVSGVIWAAIALLG